MKPTIYWIENSGAGRLGILARPQGDDALESEIQGWREAAIDVVVSMLTEAENLQLGLTAEAELCRSNGLQFISFPIKDFGVPNSLDATLQLVRELNQLLTSGKRIGFHCHGCIGRSPLIASCVLMFSGESAERAFQLVSIARGYPIPEAPEQADWGRTFARELSSFVHRQFSVLNFCLMDFGKISAGDLAGLISSGEITARRAVESSLDAAEKLNERLNAFLEINRGGALQRAESLTGQEGTLAGIPIAIKDNICVEGMQTSCGSRILGDYHPPYNASVIDRLLAAGAVIVGKTNCDEFAMGSSNENSAFGPVKNPWDTSRVPGGSSGGSAAAVAAGIVTVALGSDTGGSVRQPASLCGVVGLKPTYGRNSRYGLVAFASSLDQVGIFARSTSDVARVLGVIAGRDPHDATTADVPVPAYAAELTNNIKGARIGLPRSLFCEGLDAEVRASVQAAVAVYRELGAEIVDIELPNAQYSIAVYYIIATAEASSNLARFDGVRYGFRAEDAPELRQMYRKTREEGFGPEVKRRIMLGTYVLSAGYYEAYYGKAQQVRSLIKEDFRRAFESCDAIITPTSPTPAFLIGEKVDNPLAMYLNDIYTVTANLAGIPGLNVPCGLSSNRLPIGFQLLGAYWSEPVLFKLAHAYETAQPFTERPPISA